MDAAASDAQVAPQPTPRGLQPSTWSGIWVLVALGVLAGVRVSFRK